MESTPTRIHWGVTLCASQPCIFLSYQEAGCSIHTWLGPEVHSVDVWESREERLGISKPPQQTNKQKLTPLKSKIQWSAVTTVKAHVSRQWWKLWTCFSAQVLHQPYPQGLAHSLLRGIHTKQPSLSFINVKSQQGITRLLKKINSIKQEGKMNQNNKLKTSRKDSHLKIVLHTWLLRVTWKNI